MRAALTPDVDVRFKFLKPAGLQIGVRAEGGQLRVRFEERQTADGQWKTRECADLGGAVGSIIEMRIPFSCLAAAPGSQLAFFVAVNRAGTEIEQHPRHGPIEIDVPDQGFSVRTWTA